MNILPILDHAQLHVDFFVPGIPPTSSNRGSMKGLRMWFEKVQDRAMAAMRATCVASGPVLLMVTFVLARPRSHFRRGIHAGELRPDAPEFASSKEDCTKMLRVFENALTGLVWKGDAQVAMQITSKPYANRSVMPGVFVRVYGIVVPEYA